MADRDARRPKHKSPVRAPGGNSGERFPTTAELLGDLTKYGDKRRSEPRDIPAVSRRTRDYLLTAGIGSAVIVAVMVKVIPESSGASVVQLAVTAVGIFCALLWYIFYGVMSRY